MKNKDTYRFPDNPFLSEENKEKMAHIRQLADNGSDLSHDLFVCLKRQQELLETTLYVAKKKQRVCDRLSLEIDKLSEEMLETENALGKSAYFREKHEEMLEETTGFEQDETDNIIQETERLLVNAYQMKQASASYSLHHAQYQYSELLKQYRDGKQAYEKEKLQAEAEIKQVSKIFAELSEIENQDEERILELIQSFDFCYSE